MTDEEIAKYFGVEHLPDHLRDVAKHFLWVAQQLSDTVPRCSQLTIAFQKLLEAKDAAVRARL